MPREYKVFAGVAVVLVAIGIFIATSEEGDPPLATRTVAAETRGIGLCLVGERSLDFERLVRASLQAETGGIVSLEPGATRVVHQTRGLYDFESEYLVTVWVSGQKVGPIRSYHEGLINVLADDCVTVYAGQSRTSPH
ncbi:MAG: hypothetical protein F4150_02490 [Chloroflexi bacterium]|nr:hypothetical protein [Chloroflexota bacterium]